MTTLAPGEPHAWRVSTVVHAVAVGWWLNLKMRSRSSFDGLLGVLWPMFFATSAYYLVKAGAGGEALVFTAIGAAVMGVWSAVSATAAGALQHERRLGTLELLVCAPLPFPLAVAPIALSLATIGGYAFVTTLLYERLVFGVRIPIEHPLLFLTAGALSIFSVGMLGFVLSIAMVRYRSAWALGSSLEYIVWLAAGLLVPLAVLPGWVHPIAWFLAPTWAVEAARAACFGTAGGWAAAGACLGLGVAYGAIGAVASRSLVEGARRHAALTLS